MNKPTVFISYSHKDEEWKDRLVTHLGVLEHQGILDLWDDRRIGAGEDWYQDIQAAMDRVSVAVLLVTAHFLTSPFILDEEVPRLLEHRATEGVRLFPVIVRPCAWQQVKWLARMQVRPKDGRPLSGGSEYQIDADLAAIAEEVASLIRRAGLVITPTGYVPLGPEKISLAKRPSTSPYLFGREKELALLDAAWNPHPSPPPSATGEGGIHPVPPPSTGEGKVNVLSLVAWGGVGKTALVNVWLNQMGADNYRGAERVFGWSFYSQGAAEGRQVSADQFIAAALQWFGDPDPTQGSPWDKGERLVELVKRQRTLLILDGLEPLQSPLEAGRIKDPSLCRLLRELARQNPGLCILTTRLPVDDLKDFIPPPLPSPIVDREGGVVQVDLENLSPEAGAAYLAHLGVQGATDELRQTAQEYGGHALALTLLGTYLRVVYHGDVRQRDRIARLTDERRQGAHARRVMESYERWFQDKPELDILRMMGLFDRPAEGGALAALRRKPAIKGLTEQVQNLKPEDWLRAVENLRTARLLAAPDPHGPDTLDCHPLLREHFGEKLRQGNPQAWREAHSRLYEYYKSLAKEYPDTIEEIAPLYAAVAHGGQAGRHKEALREVYWRRIQRGSEAFNTRKLGAIGAELAILSGFFDPPWRKTVDGLGEDAKGFVLNEAGFRLRAFGRLEESVQPMQAGLDADMARKDWKNAAIAASNLSGLRLTSGDLAQALAYARQSVELADRSGTAEERIVGRTVLADVLHQAGRLMEAEALFHKAEGMQKEWQPEFPLLYSVQGFQYCDLLLSQGKYQEVSSRADQTLEWAEHFGLGLLTIALDHISMGCAHLLQAQSEGTGDYTHAATHLEHAVDGLRQAGAQEFIVRGLLVRAELRRVRGELEWARADLEEAMSIATRGGMRLFEADCYLEYARLCLSFGEKQKARENLARMKKIIGETGYHRRDGQLAELEGML
jgi:tetratricopeptide (TPR) repeat protein